MVSRISNGGSRRIAFLGICQAFTDLSGTICKDLIGMSNREASRAMKASQAMNIALHVLLVSAKGHVDAMISSIHSNQPLHMLHTIMYATTFRP